MSAHTSRAFLLVGLLVAACIPSTVAPPASPSPRALASTSSQVEQGSASPESASEAPPASVAPADTASPPAEASAPASSGLDPAAACTGTDDNRRFFADAAAAVRWTVYCAALPAGWFVDSGQYRGAGGGWVKVAYKGPGGARFELQEGGFCSAGDGCVPPGADAGEAPFGGGTGTLVALDGGDWAVVVDRGKAISWLAVGRGMNEATFRRLAGALATVGG